MNSRTDLYKNVELLPCPFCGFKPDITYDDCCYPAARDMDDQGNYVLWNINCYETHGGCSAHILGDSIEDCINKWNRRV
jgi:hypothetical protein